MNESFIVYDRMNQVIWYEGVCHEDVVQNCPNSARYTPAIINWDTNIVRQYVKYTSGEIVQGIQLNIPKPWTV
jgi:hypothetical protein